MLKIFGFMLCYFLIHNVWAQDDLLKIIDQETQESDEVSSTFKTTRIINGQSTELVHPGVLNFIIGHRFGKLNDGAYQLFGLDQSTIRFGFEYGFSKRLSLNLGRSSFQKTYDAAIKYKPIIQTSNGMPISLVIYSGLALNTLKWANPSRENLFSSRLSYFHQVLISRKFSSNLSIQLSPTIVHRNLVENENDQNDVYALGIGGRYKITNRLAVNSEYFYQFSGRGTENNHNSFAIGLDIDTGGHIFQLHFTNSQGMVENYFITETKGDFFDGDIYFGFNINRVFNIGKTSRSRVSR